MLRRIGRYDTEAWARIALYLAVLLPFAYTNSFIYPYITTKVFFFTALVQAAFFLTLISYFTKGVRLPVGPLLLLFGVHILVGLAAVLASAHPGLSMFSTPDRMEGYFLWLHLFAFFALIIVLFDQRSWYRWIRASFFVSLLIAFMGFAQYGGMYELTNNEQRVDILFGNPIFFALYTLFHIGFGILLLLHAKERWQRYLYGIALLALGTVLFFTGTRAAILGLICGAVAGLFFYTLRADVDARARFLSVGIALAGVCMLGALVFFNDSPFIAKVPYLERFSVISISNIQNQSRYYIWEAALDGVAESPAVGYGYEGFTEVFERHVEPSFYGKGLSSLPEYWMDRAHNVFLDSAINTGLIGAGLFILMLAYAAYIFCTSSAISAAEQSVLLGLLAAYSVHSLFSFNTLTGFVPLLVLLSYAHILDRRQRIYSLPVPQKRVATAGLTLVVLVAFGIAALDIDRLRFALRVGTIESSTPDASLDEIRAYRALAEKRHIDSRYLYAEVPAESVQYLQHNPPSDAEKHAVARHVAWAEDALRADRQPTAKDLYYFGEAYRHLGRFADATRVLEEGLEDAPRRLTLLLSLARVHIDAEEYKEALLVAREAYELEPTFRESALTYAAALLYTNDVKQADTILRERAGSIYVVTTRLAEAALAAGLYDRVTYMLEESVTADPERVRHWQLLLDAYKQSGAEDAHRETVDRFKEYHPGEPIQ